LRSSTRAARMAAMLFLLILWGCDRTPPEGPAARPATADSAAGKPDAGLIVAMGDSLTEGLGVAPDETYPALLEARLRAEGHPFRVINAGISGETSSGARSRLEWVLTLKPDIVILCTGANDGMRGIDPNIMKNNISESLGVLRAKGMIVVFAGMRMFRNLGMDFTGRFDAVFPNLAQTHDVIFVPFLLEGVAGKPDLNQSDGIHPNAAGYRVVVDALLPHVIQAIGRLPESGGSEAGGRGSVRSGAAG